LIAKELTFLEMTKSPQNTENMGFATETLRHRGGGALNRNGGGDTRAMRMVVKIKELSREWCVVGSDERQYCAFGYTSDCGGKEGLNGDTVSRTLTWRLPHLLLFVK
jgi:hypothetical protein